MKNICIISRYKPYACWIQGLTDPSDSKTMEGVGLSLVLHPVIKHELASKVELYIKMTKKRAEERTKWSDTFSAQAELAFKEAIIWYPSVLLSWAWQWLAVECTNKQKLQKRWGIVYIKVRIEKKAKLKQEKRWLCQ